MTMESVLLRPEVLTPLSVILDTRSIVSRHFDSMRTRGQSYIYNVISDTPSGPVGLLLD